MTNNLLPRLSITTRSCLRMKCKIVLAIALFSACGDDNVVTCARAPQFGIALHVTDAATSQSLDSIAVVTITSLTAPFDSLSGPVGDAVRITLEKPGTFRVRAVVTGYATSTRDVEVPASSAQCLTLVTQDVVLTLVRN